MQVQDILKELQSLSNAATLKHNKKSGAHDNQYGVKLGDIRKIAANIKTNHALALELWQTNNIDAKLLACLIIKPTALSPKEVTALVESIDFVGEADWFTSYILKDYPNKDQFRESWMKSKNKWAARAGWSLMASKIAQGAEGLDLDKLLDQLEKEMPIAVPEVQWTMNYALAYTGIHHPAYRARALALGEKLGILRDYPVSKGCTSPFAPIWINEMVKRAEQTKKK
ncbi:3-methyladenine DNA glycosylase AlkD [Chitinophaga skermanii]|uniref:3-methyladenine DNA glycosylase AlkD n=1 Tax=Chitinophaga skermanii TaxID=331697 RepID=A0A327PZP0_9BACT|nr:DNA alkylation repair protein [Chitinophaga skermanii]RAI97705.1 3-methyladenine DNA glycosylase AlkD [Chitinophaga skermanii]